MLTESLSFMECFWLLRADIYCRPVSDWRKQLPYGDDHELAGVMHELDTLDPGQRVCLMHSGHLPEITDPALTKEDMISGLPVRYSG